MPDHRELSDDAILNGRLKLLQPRRGHRFGHDAILLAASVPAEPGQHAVELGSGVGAAGLALLARVPDLSLVMVEIDPGLAALAAENARRNGYGECCQTVTADAGTVSAHGLPPAMADHVLMNPPFEPAGRQPSPDPKRRLAHLGSHALLDAWLETARTLLRPGGSVTVIWRADDPGLASRLANAGFGSVALRKVHGRQGRPAVRTIANALKGTEPGVTTLPPLVLNDAHSRPTEAAEAVMRRAMPIDRAVISEENFCPESRPGGHRP